mmetsp:Transcript_5843/g.16504  ORF Transcript_5843/g.16504 Transcript_5843/m.16504 type:complete len:351 (-) Transcript_5843:2667-3719(-)
MGSGAAMAAANSASSRLRWLMLASEPMSARRPPSSAVSASSFRFALSMAALLGSMMSFILISYSKSSSSGNSKPSISSLWLASPGDTRWRNKWSTIILPSSARNCCLSALTRSSSCSLHSSSMSRLMRRMLSNRCVVKCSKVRWQSFCVTESCITTRKYMLWPTRSRKMVNTIIRPAFRRVHINKAEVSTVSSTPEVPSATGTPLPGPCSMPRCSFAPSTCDTLSSFRRKSSASSGGRSMSSNFCRNSLSRPDAALAWTCVAAYDDPAPRGAKYFWKVDCNTRREEEVFADIEASTRAEVSEVSSRTTWNKTVKGKCAKATAIRIHRGLSSSVIRTSNCLRQPGTSQNSA